MKARRRRAFGWLSSRLSREGRALFAIACATAMFGADLGRSQAHVLVLASLSISVTALLFTRAFRLSGVRAELSAPCRITVGDELGISIRLDNDGPKPHHRIRIEPPRLPPDGRYTTTLGEIDELLPGKAQSARFGVRFGVRGLRKLEPFRAAALLPLGLSQGAAVLTPGARVMVVPRVARVVSLTPREHSRHEPPSNSLGARMGDASELLGVRPYRVGDPIRNLHARSWARHGAPMVREYQEQHSTRIGVVVDTDASAATAAHLEGALSLAAGIVARLAEQDAIVSVLLAGPRLTQLSARYGEDALHQVLDVLAEVQPDAGFVPERLLGALGATLPLLSSVVLVALTWDAAREALVSAIEAQGGRCLVYVVADQPSSSGRVTRVPLDAISQGRELAL